MTAELALEQKTHSAVFSLDNHRLLVPARGPDSQDSACPPRHLIFHPNIPVAYTTNEREQPGVGVWLWDTEKATP